MVSFREEAFCYHSVFFFFFFLDIDAVPEMFDWREKGNKR